MTTEIKKPPILVRLEKNNTQDCKIKIRAKKKTNGYSTYLDFSNDGKREFEFLDKKLHLTGTSATLEEDKEKLLLIVAIRNQRQEQYLKNKTGFSLIAEKDIDFVQYFEKYIEKKQSVYKSSFLHFVNFLSVEKFYFKQLDYNVCAKFAEYLKDRTGSLTSAFVYFSVFKAVLNKAVKEDILNKSPAANVSIAKAETKREFLSIEEIRILSATPKPNLDVCNAFLFSCFTGLRVSDLRALTFSQIKDGYIEFTQIKTGGHERIMLNQTALNILKIQADFMRSDKVFNMVTMSSVEDYLKKWTLAAGIKKHITFHCSRHSFATMALTNDIDIFTVSKLLGHKNITTTQIYAKLIDKKKDEAVLKLPNI